MSEDSLNLSAEVNSKRSLAEESATDEERKLGRKAVAVAENYANSTLVAMVLFALAVGVLAGHESPDSEVGVSFLFSALVTLLVVSPLWIRARAQYWDTKRRNLYMDRT